MFNLITNNLIATHYNPKRENAKGYDQFLLRDFFFKYSKKNSTTHDSYFCESLGGDPWPTKRQNGCFFGCIGCCKNDNEAMLCPAKCRPKDHQDWIYC